MRIRFRLTSVIATAVLVLTSIAFGAPAASASASAATPASTQSAAKADMAELMKSVSSSTGLIGTSWWQGAVALSTLETYQQTTGDTTWELLPFLTWLSDRSGKFEDNFDDDTGWWALVWLQEYDITHASAYLDLAETDANFIHEDWTSACGGGVWWQRSPNYYKNAIANELFLELTAWLHNTIHGDTKYLSWAKSEWNWFSRSRMIGKNYLVSDGPNAPGDKGSCVNTSHAQNEKIWTYNQGVILAGLAQLYKATGTKSYLTEAEHIANAAISHFDVKGVLTEDCKNGCGPGSQSFKGIFVRDLKVLAVTAKTTAYNSFFTRQAQSIVAKDTNAHHQLGMYWAGPLADLTSWSQASGIDALVASLKLP
jgi:Glycosyl hydrolase family 76